MSLNVAIQMDPIETINIDADSTFVLALEAQKRGYCLYHYLPTDLTLRNGCVTARARAMTVQRNAASPATMGAYETIDLSTMDVVLLRQDPPFDLAYITTTHLLEKIHPETLVVNDPRHVRNAPEKILVTDFTDLTPPTMITSDRAEIARFRAEYGDIIVKPLFGNGGAGVFHVGPDDENINSLLDLFGQMSREPVIVQRYLPEVRAGDKRIILVDGMPLGAVNRIPAKGEARSNLHVGGKAARTELTSREREICDAIGPKLRAQGLIFVGIDVIGDWLTEINVTSPTCLQEIAHFDGIHLESAIWDAIEAKLG